MSQLLVKAKAVPDADGLVVDISPEAAGWKYVGFQVVGTGGREDGQTGMARHRPAHERF